MSGVLERPARSWGSRPIPGRAHELLHSFLPSEANGRHVRAGTLQKNALNNEGLPASDAAWLAMLEKLKSFRELEDDWDGQGAHGPSEDVVNSAIDLLEIIRYEGELPAPSAVAPSPDGSVLIVWQEQDGMYCEVEVVRPSFAEVMLKLPGQETLHWTIPN